MSRFSSLEFQNPEEYSPLENQGPEVKDQAYYFDYANRAFFDCRFEEGLRYYARVLEFNPKAAAAWVGQVRMLIELGEFFEAKLWADKALEALPDEPELLAAKAVALARQGDLAGAIAFSDASVTERGNTPYIWVARGDVLLAQKMARSEYCFTKAISSAPRDWVTHWLISRVYYYYKKFTFALKHAQEAVELESVNSTVWLQLGLCQVELGFNEQASISLNHCLDINPSCETARNTLKNLSEVSIWQQIQRRFFSK